VATGGRRASTNEVVAAGPIPSVVSDLPVGAVLMGAVLVGAVLVGAVLAV
jgi:uncharacterized integral membrane protein